MKRFALGFAALSCIYVSSAHSTPLATSCNPVAVVTCGFGTGRSPWTSSTSVRSISATLQAWVTQPHGA